MQSLPLSPHVLSVWWHMCHTPILPIVLNMWVWQMSSNIINIWSKKDLNSSVVQMQCSILNMQTNMTVWHIQYTYFKFVRHAYLSGLSGQFKVLRVGGLLQAALYSWSGPSWHLTFNLLNVKVINMFWFLTQRTTNPI